MLNEKELAEIKERAKLSTPGPWEWEVFDPQQMGLGQKGKVLETTILGTDRCKACADRNAQCLWPSKENADFISHARQDIPALVAEVERLRKGIKVCADNRCPPGKEVMKYCEPGKCAMCWNKWILGGE